MGAHLRGHPALQPGRRFAPAFMGSKSNSSRAVEVVGTIMHQEQQSSCLIVRWFKGRRGGLKLLRLDCAAGGERGEEAERRCRIRREDGTKRAIQVGWQRVGGLERRAEHRGGDAEPNLLPSGASTFHPIVFPHPSFQ